MRKHTNTIDKTKSVGFLGVLQLFARRSFGLSKRALAVAFLWTILVSYPNPGFVQAATADRVLDLTDEVLRANERISKVALEIDDADSNVRQITEEIAETKASLENIEQEKAATRRFLEECMVTIYEKRVEMNLFSVFINSGSFADYLNHQRYIQEVLGAFQKKLSEYEDMDALIVKRQTELDEKLEKNREQKTKLRRAKKRLDEEIANLSAELEVVKAQNAAEIEQEMRAMEAQEAKALEEMTDPFVLGQSSGWLQNQIYDGTRFFENAYEHNQSDLRLLAGIIQAEAGNQPYEGKIAVGSVVMNRVADARFPNSISGVIYSPKQFSPVASGRLSMILAQGPNAECMQAAQDVLDGTRNVSNLYFKSAPYAAAHGITGIQIADQVFH